MTDEQFKALMDRLDRNNAALASIDEALTHLARQFGTPQGFEHGPAFFAIAQSLVSLAKQHGAK